MSFARKVMTNLLQHFEGVLVGALVGDCLGSPFEFNFEDVSHGKRLQKITKFLNAVDTEQKVGKCHYTDDTAMLRSVAASLVHAKEFDAKDLSKRFAQEFFEEPHRGYGANIPVVFAQLKESNYEDPFAPAAAQFNGRGSYGNGGAMRIAPAAMFGLHFEETQFNELVENITRITHTHKDAINGAILESYAVQLALKSSQSEKSLSASQILSQLLERMKHLESSTDQTRTSGDEVYCEKLETIEKFLCEQPSPGTTVIEEKLGNDVAALRSVPSAVFSFLRTIDGTPDDWEKQYNSFQRTIIYAISLGGDTDTIASMAGAIAGAYYGIDQIPKEWQEACEGLEDARQLAKELFNLAKQK